jgi:tetratricopeptide (TPR) repeat protein
MLLEQEIPPSCRFRVYLYGPLEVWQREAAGSWKQVEKEAWGKGRPARSVFKRLLTAPGRRLSRAAIQDDLWPDIENFELADKTVYNAINQIRRVLGKPLLTTMETLYQLADQSLIWLDHDACQILLKEAENRGATSKEALPLLEQVRTYLERGSLLEGESGTWVYGLHKKSEDLLRQCRWWLGQAYENQDKLWQAGQQYRAMLLTDPSDEETLRHWLSMLTRQGKPQQALKCYQQMKEFIQAQGLTLSASIEPFVASLVQQPPLALTSPAQPLEGILLLKQDLGEQNMNYSRRTFFKDTLGAASVAFLPEGIYLDLETLERLAKALQPSSDLDEMAVLHLEAVTRDRRSEFVQSNGQRWYDLFQEVSGHLRIITRLLEKHSQHSRLHTIAGETALLLGDLLFNAGENSAADRYYQVALAASHEDTLLRAVILGRKALISIYAGSSEKALPLLDEAQQVAPATTADLITSWLWAISGEAYANLGEEAACFQALNSARKLLERGRIGEVTLSFQPEVASAIFSVAKFSGYQGVCLLRLNRSEAAQDVLGDQLTHTEKQGQTHHKSIVLADLALSFVQQAAIRQAYKYATEALNCVEQTKSIRVFQRILDVRRALNPWENTMYVKNLDEQVRGVALYFVKGIK